MKLFLTCEHASNALPLEFISWFKKEKDRLNTHEGYDIGAFDVYEVLKDLSFFNTHYPWSRLLIEVNRSLHHSQLFSNVSKAFDEDMKQRLIFEYYQRYRNHIQQHINKTIEGKHVVLHVSIHSFTPVLSSVERQAEIGILYDPHRPKERDFAKQLQAELKLRLVGYRIRLNYPYLGKSDGFTTSLRKIFPSNYLGIELEINQKQLCDEKEKQSIGRALHEAISDLNKN
ncbi:N-formylglutamate amidohydrolase [Psychroflexus tropicus]|uniref:N-formylglutamate amidohydrolase n=1 Tax=Psychroflexus tropicus TaxID=197345 RepID=UPI000379510C|nr:N-formylglutamate amidohydrolase [Psychroflexus tropicus]